MDQFSTSDVPTNRESECWDDDEKPYGIVLAGRDQKITHVSSGFTDLTGYNPHETIGRNCGFLQGSQTNPIAVQAIRDALRDDRSCKVSLLNYRKDGTPFWNSLLISPIMDKSGRVTNYVGIQMGCQDFYVDRSLGNFKWVNTLEPPKEIKAVKVIKSQPETEDPPTEEEEATPDKADDVVPSARGHVSFVAETNLPTRKGLYRVRAYKDYSRNAKECEIIVLCHGDVQGMADVACRVHDQCFTSEVIGSMKCDCKEQLDFAMDYIKDRSKCKGGIVVYMPQEGRGIGLANKIKAYSMQELGLDTVDANRILGFDDDYREYSSVAAILEHMQVESINLLTNNPRKIEKLQGLGVTITDRIPVVCELNEHSHNYVSTKGSRMSHIGV